MSQELIKARSYIAQIATHLKQNKLIPAVHALHEALGTVLRTPLMKGEKDEFARLLDDAVYTLANNKEFKKMIPLQLTYSPGTERELYQTLKDSLTELQNAVVNEAKGQIADLDKRLADELKRAEMLLKAGQTAQAKEICNNLVTAYGDTPSLRADIGELFLRNNAYEEAYDYLAQALETSPDSLHLYNRIGMALRKLGRSEKYYHKALEFHKDDPNLHFNIGRLYIDWQRWDKVVGAAAKAIELSPDFAEAKKMMAFARKKLA